MIAFLSALDENPAALSYLRTLLRLLHFAGLVLGLGGAVFIDVILSRATRGPLTEEQFTLVVLTSRFVTAGLCLLWLSGIGFLGLYALASPELLHNPKIYAKMTIVGVLTANGWAIHKLVLPSLAKHIGRPLLAGLTGQTRRLYAATAALSGVSWTLPVVLGAAPQLNFHTPYLAIIAAHAALVGLAFGLASLWLRSAGSHRDGTLTAADCQLEHQPG
jgi:hypothetical protein